MRVGIRYKLILSITLLVVVLFTVAAYLFIQEKRKEYSDDIYNNSLAFVKLTAPEIAYNYELYLKEGSFAYFNREIRNIFKQNEDISFIKVVSFEGNIVYDSEFDLNEKFEGERLTEDLSRIQSENISIATDLKRILFIKDDEFVDHLEKATQGLLENELVMDFIVPGNDAYAVSYGLNYENLDQRVAKMVNRIVYLALFGVMLGVLMALLMSSHVVGPIQKLVIGAREIAKGNFKTKVYVKTNDEISLLGDSFNQMAIELDASMQAKIYQERVMHELKLASEIQEQLVPKNVPKVNDLDISAGIIPAEEIGGDIYDFLKFSDGKLMMYLGDVTGHGVPAGIVSSLSNALFFGFQELRDLKEILVRVNRVLKVKTLANMFMTLCLLQWDPVAKKMLYASAGHEQILHFRAKENDVILEPAGGVALGMIPDVSGHTTVREIDMQVGDYLVVYSDGIPEAWKNEKEQYGMERFKKACQSFGNLRTSLAIKEAILSDVEQFVQGYQQMDDITLMVVKRIET